MTYIKKQYIGWAQALFSVLVLWGISNVFMSYCTQILQVNKMVFACNTFISCALLLLTYAGYGKLSKETMRSFDTWGYGVIMLINYFVTLNLFSLATASEASLLQRVSVIFSVLASWLFLAREPSKGQLGGGVVIVIGIYFVAKDINPENALTIYLLMFLAGVFQSLRIFIAEFHRPHAKAVKENDVKSRCRVLGFVMFIIAMLFILCLLVFALLQSTVSAEINPKLAVSLIDFVHAPSIIGGMIMGVFIYTPIRFLEFASSHTIKAENYLTVTALSFFSTFFWEWATNSLTGLSLKDLSRIDIIAGCFITVGALVMAISKIKNIRKGNSKEEYIYREMQDWQIAQDSFDIVNNTMEYFGNDIEKVRRALNIPEDVIITIVSDENQEVAFKPDILKKVERNYRNNVARIDSLTEIYNKAGFVIKFKEIAQNSEQISMFYIDLNKFKPVNDTYGHKAGDFVLKESAKRLNTMFMNLGFTGRLGGDEFAVVLLNKNKDESKKYIEDIKLKIEEKIKFNEMDFNISASIGLANYPEDTNNPDDLMSLADKLMYKDKKEDER